MPVLNPAQAARIASGVYNIREQASVAKAEELDEGLGIDGIFSVAGATRLSGATGPNLLRSTTGFGFVARGEGAMRDEILVALRGTVSGADWLTDAKFGLSMGPGGLPVHAGFNDTFHTLSHQIDEALKGQKPKAVHCVGHSLGGALATLLAARLTFGGTSGVHLYTFGSPRVGSAMFGSVLTDRLDGRIFRVAHDSDPVPMLPIFPYLHVPLGGTAYPIVWNGGGRMFWNAHRMQEYIASVGDHAWGALAGTPTDPFLADIKGWLDSRQLGPAMFAARTLGLIAAAIQWLIKKAMLAIGGTAILAGATMLDKLAWILSSGAAAEIELENYTATLIARIMAWLGRTMIKGAKLTVTFIRWVLELLVTTVTSMYRLAVRGAFG